MGRKNIYTDGVLTRIMGEDTNPFLNFLEVQELLNAPNKELQDCLDEYNDLINNIGPELVRMSKVETLILQLRTLQNLDIEDIKLNVVRQYIYARITFPRYDTQSKDLRIIVGTTDKFGTNVKRLRNKELFYKTAKEKLSEAMRTLIDKTILEYNTLE